MMKRILTLLLLACSLFPLCAQGYVPSESNLAARKEFTQKRLGIFIHWGLYASYAQGEWYLHLGELNKDEYAKAAASFNPVGFDADEWVAAFKDAGAGYLTFTSRHHDGFSMFKTATSTYNVVDGTPFGRDIVGELEKACKEGGIRLHLYYSLLDWIREDYPIGESGKKTGRKGGQENYDSYFRFMETQVKELLTQYPYTGGLWFDGIWDHKRDQIPFDWRMPEFYRFIHALKPDCLIGNNHHITPFEGEDFQMFERDLPGQNTAGYSEGQQVSTVMPVEMCQTMNKSWGYTVKDLNYKSTTDEHRSPGRRPHPLAECRTPERHRRVDAHPRPQCRWDGQNRPPRPGLGRYHGECGKPFPARNCAGSPSEQRQGSPPLHGLGGAQSEDRPGGQHRSRPPLHRQQRRLPHRPHPAGDGGRD